MLTLRLNVAVPPAGMSSAGLKENTVVEPGLPVFVCIRPPPTLALSVKAENNAGLLWCTET